MSKLSAPVTLLTAVVAVGASISTYAGALQANDKVTLQVSGITTATVALQGSVDGTTFLTIGTPVTADGFITDTTTLPYYRANVTAWTAGAITAKLIF